MRVLPVLLVVLLSVQGYSCIKFKYPTKFEWTPVNPMSYWPRTSTRHVTGVGLDPDAMHGSKTNPPFNYSGGFRLIYRRHRFSYGRRSRIGFGGIVQDTGSTRFTIKQILGLHNPQYTVSSANGSEWNGIARRYTYYRIFAKVFVSKGHTKICQAVVHWSQPLVPVHIDYPGQFSRCY